MLNEPPKKIVTPLMALEKCRKYCAYQERSQNDVRKKLHSWQIDDETTEGIIAQLISEQFISESRFVKAFASGKFRILHWGRIKIKHELRLKKIPEKLIREALNSIDSNEYKNTLKRIIEKKNKELHEKNYIRKRQKVYRFAISKGYENDLVREMIQQLFEK
ncbi:MAG: regulatory protein RecX [Bacteroidota bacterium]